MEEVGLDILNFETSADPGFAEDALSHSFPESNLAPLERELLQSREFLQCERSLNLVKPEALQILQSFHFCEAPIRPDLQTS